MEYSIIDIFGRYNKLLITSIEYHLIISSKDSIIDSIEDRLISSSSTVRINFNRLIIRCILYLSEEFFIIFYE
jgi:hypothetical protein